MIIESHIGGREGREMGRFVGDRIFSKGTSTDRCVHYYMLLQ